MYKEVTMANAFCTLFGETVKEHSNCWMHCISKSHTHLNVPLHYSSAAELIFLKEICPRNYPTANLTLPLPAVK